MNSYLLKLPLQRKEPELQFDACQVEAIHRMSAAEFRYFQHNLLEEYDFLRAYNREYSGSRNPNVRSGILVLGEGSNDGVFVCTEGSDYARYSALVPNANQILLLKEYPALQDYGNHMARLADKYIGQAIQVGLPEALHISVYDLQGESMFNSFNEELFAEMLSNRPEVENAELNSEEVLLTICPEYLPERQQNTRTLSEEDFKISCAKHLLWCYGVGGEQADFSNCRFENVSFAGLELNSARFDGAVFEGCNLSGASVCFASFKGCVFRDCNCSSITAEEANLQDAVFDRCNLHSAILMHSDYSRAAFLNSRMEGASLQNCLLDETKFENTDTGSVNLSGSTTIASAWISAEQEELSSEDLT